MIGTIKHTRAALWLGSRLAEGPEFASRLLREGGAVGFAPEVVRAAFGEISANVNGYGQNEIWELAPVSRQFWANWIATVGVAPPSAGAERITEYRRTPGATRASPATAAPAPAAAPTAAPAYDKTRDPVFLAFQKMSRDVREARAQRELASEAQPANPGPTISAREIFARRKRAHEST